MADGIELDAGSGGATLATDDGGASGHYQYVKLAWGADDTQNLVTAANPIPISWAGTAPPIGAGTEAAALRVTIATDSTGLLSIDDGGASLTVDNAGLTELAAAINSSRLDVNLAADAVGLATSANQDTGNTALAAIQTAAELLDNAVYVDDADWTDGTSSHLLIGGLYQSSPQSITDGDVGPIQLDANGRVLATVNDGGGSITVDGTVAVTGVATSANQDTANTALSAIQTAVEILDNAISGSEMQVDVVTSALPSGAATAANQSTANSALSAIQTAVQLLDNAVSGNEFQVDVVASLPAGTNAIGKLSANSGVDIGDVDVTSVIPGTAATSLGKAEDAAHSGGDTGVMSLAVRNDDLAALAGTDGDYAPLQVSQNGALLTAPTANDDYKYAAIDDASSGDNTLVAAVASRKLRVLSAFIVAAGTVNARFEDGAGGTALTGQMNLVANTGFVLPFNPAGWFETSANTLLNLELSAAISVDGSLTYIEVP